MNLLLVTKWVCHSGDDCGAPAEWRCKGAGLRLPLLPDAFEFRQGCRYPWKWCISRLAAPSAGKAAIIEMDQHEQDQRFSLHRDNLFQAAEFRERTLACQGDSTGLSICWTSGLQAWHNTATFS
jgi:hypothetical protein